MAYHDWSDDKVDWKGINDAAYFIASNLKKWGRVQVRDFKEKYGNVRIYLSFGWYNFHSITHPGYIYSQYPNWLWMLDCKYGSKIIKPLNSIIIPLQAHFYKFLYKKAINKWPHLAEEILCLADYRDTLLKDLWDITQKGRENEKRD